ncbi:MAG: O-antigen ligase family protein [Fusobacteriaceae bacterium]
MSSKLASIKKIDYEKLRSRLTTIILALLPICMAATRLDNFREHIIFPILILVVIGQIFKNGFKISFYEKYYIAFSLILILSVIFQNFHGESFKAVRFAVYFGIFPVLFGQLDIKKKDYKLIISSYIFSVLFILYHSYNSMNIKFKNELGININFFTSFRVDNLKIILKSGADKHWSQPYGDKITSSLMLGICFIMLLTYIFNAETKNKIRITLIPFAILSFYYFSLLRSRGMFLGIIAASFLCIFQNKKGNFLKLIFYSLLFLIILLFVLKFMNTNNIFSNSLVAILNGDEARMVVYKESFKLFLSNPLTGIGYGNFPEAEKAITNTYFYWGKYQHEHNMSLKLLAETGIFGFITYYMMMGAIVFNLWKKRNENIINKVALFCLVSLLVYECFETIIRLETGNEFLIIIIAIALNPFYKNIDREKLLSNIKKYFKKNGGNNEKAKKY